MSLFEVYQLDVFTYWALLHDAVVYDNAQTTEGREWLHNAWRITQTEPDRPKLHSKIRTKGGIAHGSKNN